MTEIEAIRFGFSQNTTDNQVLAFKGINLSTNYASHFAGENSDVQVT